MTERRLTGWLGGTFDPIHEGHLDVARAAHAALGLSRVILVPAAVSPFRTTPTASAEHRLSMAQLAAAGTNWLDTSAIELEHPGPSYTAVTLDRLEAQGTSLSSLCLITGADAFAGFTRWHRWEDILRRVTIAVVSRPGSSVAALPDTLPQLAGHWLTPEQARSPHGHDTPGVVLIDAPTADVSSTDIRARLTAGASISGMVPEAVEVYIRHRRIY
jgi:nicotinate-nucleotide adenylyltransferase